MNKSKAIDLQTGDVAMYHDIKFEVLGQNCGVKIIGILFPPEWNGDSFCRGHDYTATNWRGQIAAIGGGATVTYLGFHKPGAAYPKMVE